MSRHAKRRIREKAPVSFFGDYYLQGNGLSRRQAIARIQALLASNEPSQEALYLVELFNIAAEELSEAGLAYEALSALRRVSVTL